jgi:hypothetical protein
MYSRNAEYIGMNHGTGTEAYPLPQTKSAQGSRPELRGYLPVTVSALGFRPRQCTLVLLRSRAGPNAALVHFHGLGRTLLNRRELY